MGTLTAVRSVAVPVSDQDRAKALFERLGLTSSFDAELQPGFRWIELSPDGGRTVLALVPGDEELPVGIDTGIRFVTADARAAHIAVREAGATPGELLDWDTAPLMFSFTDFDGNRFYVAENDPGTAD